MLDRFNREINYLRVSVTDRCNLRCKYCMPEEGIPLVSHNKIMRFSEIIEVIGAAVDLGIKKIRITGGEPLLRRDIVNLVKMISEISGIEDLAMTTNGILLPQFAADLKNAGLKRVNISLDTMNPDKYKEITRRGFLDDALKGIIAAKEAGLEPIKINCVIKYSSEEYDAQQVTEFCNNNNLQVRYIREMDLEKGYFWKVKGGDGGNCKLCNRLRLTSTGMLKPCLFGESEYNVRILGAMNALIAAIENKPESGSINRIDHFNEIGG